MQIFKAIPLVVLGWTLLIGVGCAKPPSKHTFLLPVLSSDGSTVLKEVTLDTLSDPSEVSGEAAVVMYNPALTANGVSGSATKTRLSRTGDVYIPMDFPTSSALSVYHSFENLKNFDQRVLPEYPLSWPRTVGLDLLFSGGFAENNAFYAGLFDFTGVGPYSMSNLPLSFNSGIMAHEHFHAHFYKIMGAAWELEVPTANPHAIEQLDGARCGLEKHITVRTRKDDPRYVQVVNHFILRAWNEGLADFYAAAVSGNTNFLDVSFNMNGKRKVDQKVLGISSRATVEDALNQDLLLSSGPCSSMSLAYEIGSEIARNLHSKMSAGDFDSYDGLKLGLTREERTLRLVFETLKKQSEKLKTMWNDETLEPKWILDQIKTSEGSPLL